MSIQQIPVVLVLFLFFVSSGFAQQSTVAAGGDISGVGGTISFSTGLPDFEFFSGDGGSIQMGMQHALPISIGALPEEEHLYDMVIGTGERNCYAALLTITTAGSGETFVVEEGGHVDLIAASRIIMKEGTKVEQGGYLHARITTDGTFCPEPDKHFLAATEEEQQVTPDNFPNIEQPEKFFKVFPNPTTGRFTLELKLLETDKKVIVEVYGMRGERILREGISGNIYQHNLNLEGQLPGIYIIRVVSGDQYGVGRIIKR